MITFYTLADLNGDPSGHVELKSLFETQGRIFVWGAEYKIYLNH